MGWFMITIILPLLAPLLALLVFRCLPLPTNVQTNLDLMVPLKDGQLCWGALGFCAAALYDIAVPGPSGEIVPAIFRGWTNGGLISLLLAAAMFAAGGSIFPTPIAIPPNVTWCKHFRCFVASLYITVIAAATYSVVHYGVLMTILT